ncbi:MAG TPA: polyhydroxyalkanoate depolymerase, partial [Alphaproteobacteria bacterium]|nr:polyhydroxyalkanoate depolymerase [Alphaproteobacteria bacterium]
NFAAAAEVVGGLTRNYKKPEWNIEGATPETVIKDDFGSLVHFKTAESEGKPKMLLVAPMSGHFATLLRGTVKGLLPNHDVYVTDWANARDIPMSKGSFDLNSFIDTTMKYIGHFKGDVDVMAVCQPGPAVTAAVALIHQKNDPTLLPPRSLVIMASPIDVRAKSNAVIEYANKLSIEDFERMVIHRVPLNYDGAGRRVYPGWMQLTSFMGMNPDRHIDAHVQEYKDILAGNTAGRDAHRKFYDEYFAACDLPAEFYLQTVNEVFKEASIAKGEFYHHGQRVDLGAITKTALMVVEGGKDDISGGQSAPLLDLTTGIPASRKTYHLQPDVGHYGVFSGSKWENIIAPKVAAFVHSHMPAPKAAVTRNRRTAPAPAPGEQAAA